MFLKFCMLILGSVAPREHEQAQHSQSDTRDVIEKQHGFPGILKQVYILL